MIVATLVAALVGGADLCDPVDALPTPNPREAAIYLKVALAEQQAHHTDTALIAFHAALARDPGNSEAALGWSQICQERRSPQAYAEAAKQVDNGQWRAALKTLRDVTSEDLKLPAALLAGLCHYQLYEDIAAREQLNWAAKDPQLADAAQLFLGLIARRAGRSNEAREWISQVLRSGDPTLRQAAALLNQSIRGEGRLNLNATVGLAYDSNVNQAPPGASSGAGQDGLASAWLGVTGRPLGMSGPFFQANGYVRQQFTLQEFSFYGIQGTAGWDWVHDGKHVGGQYTYEYAWLGGPGYLSNHRLSAWIYWPIGSFTLSALYDVRFERYLPTLYADFSGVRHTGVVGATWASGIWLVGLSYRVAWDGTRDPSLTYFEHGPSLDVQAQFHPALRAFAGAGFFARPYQQFDPNLGLQRSDLLFVGQAGLSWSMTDSLALVGSVLARGTSSNVPALTYVEVVTTVSLAANLGFF